MGAIETAYESTHRPTDEKILIAALTNFSLRSDVRDVLANLNPDDFYNSMYGDIWREARTLAEDSRIMTLEALKSRFEKTHKDREGEPPQWRVLEQSYGQPVRLVEVVRAAQLVSEAAKNRRLVDVLKRVADTVCESEDYESPLGVAHTGLSELDNAEKSDDATSIESGVDSFWTAVDSPELAAETVIPSPWPDLNELINGGVAKKRLYVFGAESGGGKSLAMLNVASEAAMNGYKVAVFSIEMSASEVTARLISSTGRFPYSKIAQHDIPEHQREQVEAITQSLRDKHIVIYDQSDVSMQFIRQQCLALKRSQGLDLVVVDYIQIVQPESGGPRDTSREQQVGEVAKRLKILAGEVDVVMLTASQLNDNEQGNRPSMRSLRESKALGMHADAVILLHHEKERGHRTGVVDLMLVKNRVGREGSLSKDFASHQARIGNLGEM